VVRAGHWLIVAFLAVLAAFSFWMLIKSARELPEFVNAVRTAPATGPGESVGFYIKLRLLLWIPALICAWGVLKWRRWGQALTITLCGLALCLWFMELVLFGRPYLAFHWFATALAATSIILWLSLPQVRSQFRV
jgi:hypothetical protein